MQVTRTFAVLINLLSLAACSSTSTTPSHGVVFFSHSDPAPIQVVSNSNRWSPSQWRDPAVRNVPEFAKAAALAPPELVIYFDTDSDQPTGAELQRLSDFIREVGPVTGRKFQLVGHTDSQSNAPYNQFLSERRVATVSKLLGGLGVDPIYMTIQARGLQEPVASNESEAGRAKNRRVTIRILE